MKASILILLTLVAVTGLALAPAAEACVYVTAWSVTFCQPGGTHLHTDGSSADTSHCSLP